MTKRLIAFMMCFLIIFTYTPSLANDNTEVDVNFTCLENRITLSAAGMTPGKELTAYVTDDTEIFSGEIYAVTQFQVGADGSFLETIIFPENLATGMYRAMIGGCGENVSNEERHFSFAYENPQEIYYLWIEGEDALNINGDYRIATDNKASGGKRIGLDSVDDSKVNELEYSFDIDLDNNYDIWVLSSSGNVDYVSKYKYSLDSNEYAINTADNLSTVYTTSDDRQVPLAWSRIQQVDLTVQTHSLKFKCDEKRSIANDFYYHSIDAIVIVSSKHNWIPEHFNRPYSSKAVRVNYVSGEVSAAQAEREETFSVLVENVALETVSGDPTIYAGFMRHGELVAYTVRNPAAYMSSWEAGRTYTDTIEVTVPFSAPDDTYDVICGIGRPFDIDYQNTDTTPYAIVGEILVGEANTSIAPVASFSNVSMISDGEYLNLSMSVCPTKTDVDSKAYVKLYKEEVLWGVCESAIAMTALTANDDNSIELQLEIPQGIPSGSYRAETGIYRYNGTAANPDVAIVSNEVYGYKPLSSGNYISGKTGVSHFWYVNQQNALIWDGEPYIPMGGMECLMLPVKYKEGDNAYNQTIWDMDKAELQILKQNGVRDIYINPVSYPMAVPGYVWQFIFDYLDENDFHYGFQLGTKDSFKNTDNYYIRSNATLSPFAVDNVSSSGVVSLIIGNEQFGGYNVQPREALYVLVNSSGELINSGICDFTKIGDTQYQFAVDVSLPAQGIYSVYFTPMINENISTYVNFWDYGSEILDELRAFSGKLSLGDNFRMIVDPLANESGLYNALESIRPSSANYNALFRQWLEAKYDNEQALSSAWQIENGNLSYQTAAELIPVYTSNNASDYYVYCTDGIGNIYKLNGRQGVMWADFIQFRDEAYAEFNNKAANALKENLDVPVIVKNVWGAKDYFTNKSQTGGLDGIGTEAYGNYARLRNLQSSSYGIGKQFGKTAWLIVTETSVDEDISQVLQNGNYPTEDYMHAHFNTLFDMGAKGIFDFVFSARHDDMTHSAYSYIAHPEKFTWLADYVAGLNKNDLAAFIPSQKKMFLMPYNSNFYTNPNRFTAVYYNDSYESIIQSVADDTLWVMQTNNPFVEADVIAANFTNAPASVIWGKAFGEMLESKPQNKKAVYLGLRNDLGAVPNIDQYFTQEMSLSQEGDTVQILAPTQTSVVLATDINGNPWAIQDGSLWIFANANWCTDESVKFINEYDVFETQIGLTKLAGSISLNNNSEEQSYEFKYQISNTKDEAAYVSAVLVACDSDNKLVNISIKETEIARGINEYFTKLSQGSNDKKICGYVFNNFYSLQPIGDVTQLLK